MGLERVLSAVCSTVSSPESKLFACVKTKSKNDVVVINTECSEVSDWVAEGCFRESPLSADS